MTSQWRIRTARFIDESAHITSVGKIRLVRVLATGAFASGVIGLVVGLIEREWRLGVTGWFSGGTLLALLALALLVDAYVETRSHQSQ